MLDAIRIERRYAYPIAKVWRALTEPELVSRWLMPTDLRAEEGYTFTFTTQPRPGFDGLVQCRMLTVDPPHELAYAWAGGGIDTVVRFRLESAGEDRTILHFEQTGFSGLFAKLVARNVLNLGWRRELFSRKLPALLREL